jgi:uncharacterized protein
MNKKIIIIVLLVLLGIGTLWYYLRHPLTAKATIHDTVFSIELAISAQEKEKGLAYRDNIPDNHGMLFLFDHEQQYNFWMKDMRFPIDILWIRESTVLDITPNVPVANPPYSQYAPKYAVDKVLELKAGTVERYGITVGDKVKFSD